MEIHSLKISLSKLLQTNKAALPHSKNAYSDISFFKMSVNMRFSSINTEITGNDVSFFIANKDCILVSIAFLPTKHTKNGISTYLWADKAYNGNYAHRRLQKANIGGAFNPFNAVFALKLLSKYNMQFT